VLLVAIKNFIVYAIFNFLQSCKIRNFCDYKKQEIPQPALQEYLKIKGRPITGCLARCRTAAGFKQVL
jgi:hypothetical protein